MLRHELAILRRRTRRPVMTWTDHLFLAAASRLLPRACWRSFIITPPPDVGATRALRSGSRKENSEARRRSRISLVHDKVFEPGLSCLINHVRAMRQSRATVSADTSRTCAVSSTVSPEKNRSSMTRTLRASNVASVSSA